MEEESDKDVHGNKLLYPKIENIFSNAVNIKSEPIDIDSDDDYQAVEVEEYDDSNNYYVPFTNRIILGSKPSQPSAASVESFTQDTLLGEGPVEIFRCEDCDISFPTQNELDSHRSTVHSFLIARAIVKTKSSSPSISSQTYSDDSAQERPRSRQKAIKSTAKSSLLNKSYPLLHNVLTSAAKNRFSVQSNASIEKTDAVIDKSDKLLCKHCDTSFPDEIALIKHTYELIPEKESRCEFCKMDFVTASDLQNHNRTLHRKRQIARPPDKFLQCTYCTCLLKYPNGLRKHVLLHHKTTACVIKYVKFPQKCGLCYRQMDTQKQYNSHVTKCHHKVCHQSHRVKSSEAKRGAIKKQEGITSQETGPMLPGPAATTEDALIPKQTLFKCNKCQINFVYCSAAVEHTKRCVLAKGDWKCSKCRRSFTHRDKHVHTLQHILSDKFNVHTVDRNITSRVLNRCPKCEVHFDEKSIWGHVSKGCDGKSGVDCNVCKLEIHSKSFMRHRRNHGAYNLTREDFIVVDFVDGASVNGDIVQKEVDTEAAVTEETGLNTFYICMTCKTNTQCSRLRPMHVSGDCKKLTTRMCIECGLSFTQKTIKKHTYNHHRGPFNLNDYTFVRYHDRKVIKPPMPEFKKCTKCKVRFVHAEYSRTHKCAKNSFRKCDICHQKYDIMAYELHMPYHEYNLSSAASVTAESIPKKVFYACISCNYGFNSYDDLVEHCQKHYISSEYMETVPCKMCQLNYAESHHGVHAARLAFEILKFNHRNLLTDDWFEGFQTGPKRDSEKILSQSVYGAIRSIRLEVFKEGPAERTLYRCAKCNLHLDVDNVVGHAKDVCIKSPRYPCNSCGAVFRTITSRVEHAHVHVVFGDDIAFREIVFNSPHDKQLNEALATGTKKESLKFRKCQYCPALVKMDQYQRHKDEHETANGAVKVKTVRKKSTFRLLKTSGPKRMYTVYQCKNCKANIVKKSNVSRHGCQRNDVQCAKCSLWYRRCFKKRHDGFHAKLPKFITSNIRVIEFELTGSSDVVKRKRNTSVTYASEDSASNKAKKIARVEQIVGVEKIARVERAERKYASRIRETKYSNGEVTDDIKDDLSQIEANQNVSTDSVGKNETEKELKASNPTPDITKWLKERRQYLYQCERCSSCFMFIALLIKHKFICNGNEIDTQYCNYCQLRYDKSMVSFHESLHSYVVDDLINDYFCLTKISLNGSDPFEPSNWLHLCKVCDAYYLSEKSLDYHLNKNHKTMRGYVNCDICNVKFPPVSLANHTTYHHKYNTWSINDANIAITEKMIISPIKTDETGTKEHCDDKIDNKTIDSEEESAEMDDETEKIKCPGNVDRNLYKCHLCSSHFTNKYTWEHHMKTKQHSSEEVVSGVQCDICGLNFGKRTLLKHKNIQHDRLKLNLEDFIINTVNGKLALNDQETAGACDSDRDVASSVNVMEIESTAECIESDSHVDHNVFKCIDCSTHYETKSKLINHVDIEKHGPSNSSDCDECGLRFDNDSLKIHKIVQHDKLKLNRNDFVITDISGSRVCNDTVNDGIKTANVVEKRAKRIFKLYQCKDCRVCVGKAQREYHVCCSDIQKKYCTRCCISFRSTDFVQHRSLHRRQPNLSRNSILIVKFGHRTSRNHRIYKCTTCSTHFASLKAFEWHIDVRNHQIKREQCKFCDLYFGKYSLTHHISMHHKKLRLSKENFNFVYVSDSNKNLHEETTCNIKPEERSSNDSNENLNSTTSESDLSVTKTVKKLFKCFECEVYFPTQVSYYQHMYNHAPLDPTEYIACKMCDLQFQTEVLAEHMRSHRDKSFNLNNLLVQGYLPDGNELTECYFTVSGLNSKMVSTTTPFDNEVDTVSRISDEQMSTIDSTSDEVAKTMSL